MSWYQYRGIMATQYNYIMSVFAPRYLFLLSILQQKWCFDLLFDISLFSTQVALHWYHSCNTSSMAIGINRARGNTGTIIISDLYLCNHLNDINSLTISTNIQEDSSRKYSLMSPILLRLIKHIFEQNNLRTIHKCTVKVMVQMKTLLYKISHLFHHG